MMAVLVVGIVFAGFAGTTPASAAPVTLTATGSFSAQLNAKSATFMQATANLNVRSGPGTKNRVIKTLKKGTTVRVASTKNGWTALQGGGYVSAKFLKKVSATAAKTEAKKTSAKPAAKPSAPSSYTTKYTTAALNVRSGSNTKSKVIKTLKKGAAVSVAPAVSGWLKVSTGGFVSSKYVTASKSTAAKVPAKSDAPSTKFSFATQVAAGHGFNVKRGGGRCSGIANLLGCYEGGATQTIYITDRGLSRSEADVKFIILHEVSHGIIDRKCYTATPAIVGKRVENVTDAHAVLLGAKPQSIKASHNANDLAIAKKIQAGICK